MSPQHTFNFSSTIFTTKNKELAIFGKTLTETRRILIDFFEAFERGGIKGESGIIDTFFLKNKTSPLTPELLMDFEKFKNKFNSSSLSAEAVNEALDGVSEKIVNYAKTCKNGEMTTKGFKASVEGMTLSEKAATAATKALAMAGNMLVAFLVTKSIKLFVKALDKSADSLADVEARIQENQNTLSDYTSKIEDLTAKLKDLNNTDTTYFSDEQKTALETETAYIESQIELYHQLAEAKQKAINDDYIKAAIGENEELFIRKTWDELSNGE